MMKLKKFLLYWRVYAVKREQEAARPVPQTASDLLRFRAAAERAWAPQLPYMGLNPHRTPPHPCPLQAVKIPSRQQDRYPHTASFLPPVLLHPELPSGYPSQTKVPPSFLPVFPPDWKAFQGLLPPLPLL